MLLDSKLSNLESKLWKEDLNSLYTNLAVAADMVIERRLTNEENISE